MYVVRNVFKAKPGKAKELVAKFKQAERFMQGEGVVKSRILTDTVSVSGLLLRKWKYLI